MMHPVFGEYVQWDGKTQDVDSGLDQGAGLLGRVMHQVTRMLRNQSAWMI